jgi:hypothetical protein
MGDRLQRFVDTFAAVQAHRAARAKLAAMPHRPSSGWGVGWAEGGMLPREATMPTVPRADLCVGWDLASGADRSVVVRGMVRDGSLIILDDPPPSAKHRRVSLAQEIGRAKAMGWATWGDR